MKEYEGMKEDGGREWNEITKKLKRGNNVKNVDNRKLLLFGRRGCRRGRSFC
jgi:hypothetical protein